MLVLKNKEKIELTELVSLIGKIKAIVYARVSSMDQALHGYSLESQVEKCVDRAKKKFGYTEDEIIVLVEEGGMGDDPNRPMLNYMLFLLEKGIGKKVIILHPDRLARHLTLQNQISDKIWQLGIDIEFVEFEVDPTNPESLLMFNIQGSIAQYNKAKIHANSRRGRFQKAKKGEIPICSRIYGYTYDKEKDMLIINEEEKEVLLEMKRLILEQNKSCNQIAQILSKKGIPAAKGNIWHNTSVLRMLKNETYKGVYWYGKTKIVQKQGKKKSIPVPKEEWIGIPIEPIFTDIEFEMIQQKIESHKGKRGRPSQEYLLRGIGYCGRCGYSVRSGIVSKSSLGVINYYACHLKKPTSYTVGTGESHHPKCVGRNWRVDYVDNIVWNTVTSYINNPDKLIEELTKNFSDENKIQSMFDKKQSLESKLESLKKEESRYILLFGKEKITEKQLDEFTEPINKQIAAITDELDIIVKQLVTFQNKYDSISALKKNISKYQELIKGDNLDMESKRELVQLLVRKVYMNEDNTIRIILTWEPTDEEHEKSNHQRQEGSIFHASVNKTLPPRQTLSYKDFTHLWDEIYDLHFNQLMSFNEIRKKFGITRAVLQNLFKDNNCDYLRRDELYEIKVSKDSEFICDLIKNKGYSVRRVISEYKFTIEYIKKALEIEERKQKNN